MEKGQLFSISLSNSVFAYGQILQVNSKDIKCLTVGLFDHEPKSCGSFDGFDNTVENCYSLILITPDLGDHEFISVGATDKIRIPSRLFPFRKKLKRDGIGVKMHNPKVLHSFAKAYYSLSPWDGFHDPHYFDKLLLNSSKKPNSLLYS